MVLAERANKSLHKCFDITLIFRPGGNPGVNIKSISHRYYLREVALQRELTKETIYLPLGCLQGSTPVMPYGGVPPFHQKLTPHATILEAMCGANVVSHPSEFSGNETSELNRVVRPVYE